MSKQLSKEKQKQESKISQKSVCFTKCNAILLLRIKSTSIEICLIVDLHH